MHASTRCAKVWWWWARRTRGLLCRGWRWPQRHPQRQQGACPLPMCTCSAAGKRRCTHGYVLAMLAMLCYQGPPRHDTHPGPTAHEHVCARALGTQPCPHHQQRPRANPPAAAEHGHCLPTASCTCRSSRLQEAAVVGAKGPVTGTVVVAAACRDAAPRTSAAAKCVRACNAGARRALAQPGEGAALQRSKLRAA